MIKTKEREVKSVEIAYYPFSSGNGLTANLTDPYRRKNTVDNGPHISHVK